MARITQWERQIGRRLRLRDLFVFFTVVKAGSMARAATELGVSTPSVSEIMADLESALGVKLLDRSPRGVVATAYGQALLRRGAAAFDELRQGINEIELLSDPTAGEVNIGCSWSRSRRDPAACHCCVSPTISACVARHRLRNRHNLCIAAARPQP